MTDNSRIKNVTEIIDDEVYTTDSFLTRPGQLAHRLQQVKERYETLSYRASGVTGFDYERAGKYGCKITGGEHRRDDTLVDMVEVGKELEALEKEYEDVKKHFLYVLSVCGMTWTQQQVMTMRHIDNTYPSYTQIAQSLGLRNYDAAWYQYKTAYVKLSNYLQRGN